MFQSFVPLRRTGPYKQSEIEGMFGKTHAIPEINPDNGTYMPKCSPGPCAEYRYWYNDKGEQQQSCVRYLEPTVIPHATNFFNSNPDKPRTSCGYDANPVGLFSSEEPTYYVYWEDAPKGGKRTNKHRKKSRNKSKKTYRKRKESRLC